ncbi:MAG: Mini-ribonuclease 3 [Clostridia bacterium]|nr:Mini-ribonuclease 3 [Clostridia bacterium]
MLTRKKPSQFAPLTLAYIGDDVYDIYVRTRVIEEHEDMPPNKLHRITSGYVRAHAQANSIKALLPYLTEDETAIFKRGRNSKPYTMAKNATAADYHMATGLEALFGFLYLSEKTERLNELMQIAYENAHTERNGTLDNKVNQTREEK